MSPGDVDGGPERPHNIFACLLLFYGVYLKQGLGRKQEHSVEIIEESLIKEFYNGLGRVKENR